MLKVNLGLSRIAAAIMAAGFCITLLPAQGQRQVNPVKPAADKAPRAVTSPVAPVTAANTIQWIGFETLKSVKTPKALSFKGAGFTEEGLPMYTFYLQGQAREEFTLTNTTYEALTAEEAAAVPASYTASQPQVTSTIGLEMGNPVTIARFVPLRVNPATGQKEKLVSFSYTSRPARNVPRARIANNSLFGTNSVLNTSNPVYRVGVAKTGIYKIDRQYLASLGYNPDQVDPNLLQVYGNGGGMLPQPNSAFRHNDLVQNAVAAVHNGNNTFEEGEYLLFYGEGPHAWAVNQTQNRFVHTQNIYSDTTYYFITVGNTPGLRVSEKASLPAAGQLHTSSDERVFHENEAENFLKSGRNWFGEKFNSFTSSRDFTLPLTGMKPGTAASLLVQVLSTSNQGATFQVVINGQNAGSIGVGAATPDNQGYGNIAQRNGQVFSQEFNAPPADMQIKLAYNGGNSTSANGYLDYLELNYQRQLRLTDNIFVFRKRLGIGAATAGTFRLTNTTPNTLIWDVTNPVRPVQQQGNNLNGEFTFTTDSLGKREFVAFDGNNFPNPVKVGKVTQQNLHALNLNGDLDLVMVVHPKFMAAAEQLAQHRRTHDGLQVAIVTPQQVYNEFSSGAQDITAIRDMMRMVYQRRNAGKRLLLLLFGDASYDYKYRKAQNTNYVPIYEAPDAAPALNNIYTHSSDDYFGFLDDDEGAWGNSDEHLMDIGIGRLPVNTIEDAQTVVIKLIAYDSPETYGKWRNTITLIADDEDGGGNPHFTYSEIISSMFEDENPNANIKKLYLDAFPQVSVASGQRAPAIVEQLNRTIEQGTLIVNFVGHGSETGWMHERILDIAQIQQWSNKTKPAFFVTATCEFGRYDDPDRNSGGEFLLISAKGGGIGLLTTTRPVYGNSNQEVNEAFVNSVYTPINGQMPRLGDVLRFTKNNSVQNQGVNNRNFALLGDPSARLAYPEHNIQITKINGAGNLSDTLKALSLVSIEGQVTDAASGNLRTDFNQQLQATVYEKTSALTTLGDGTGTPRQFQVRQNIIYDGLATVTNGTFKFEFVVPKDINYSIGLGKISLYSQALNTDAAGNNSTISIGGTDPNAGTDALPPDANLFMNDETFVFGGTTGKDATFLAKLYDENGINTAGIGIGHELKATLDEKEEFVLNEYYTADVNSYKSGTIRFPFKGLENGPHSIKLKVWDTHNNSRDEYLEFIVVNEASLALEHVLNYPNPFSQQTTFHFDHNRAGDQLEYMVQIFTVSGRLVKTITQQATDQSGKSHVQSAVWNGRDEFNDKLAKGVYVYKVSVRSLRDGSKAHEYQKLVILN